MSIISIICNLLGLIFSVLYLIFLVLKEKGSILISGFNSFPKEKREQYDSYKLVEDTKKEFLKIAVVSFIGAVSSQLFHIVFGIIALIAITILFFRQVSFSPDKAFEKYKINPYK